MLNANILRYLRDCYRADNVRATLWNVYADQCRRRAFLTHREELLDGFVESSVLPQKIAARMHADALTYRRERQLLYGAVFAVGRADVGQETSRFVCAPILLAPAEIELAGEAATFGIDLDRRRLNHRVLDSMQPAEDTEKLSDRCEALLGETAVGETDVARMVREIEASVPGLDASTMFEFPRLGDEASLKAALEDVREERTNGWRLIPAAAVCLVDRPVETRGILSELEAIAESGSYSRPLRVFVGQPDDGGEAADPMKTDPLVPAILSASQQRILENSRAAPLSVAVGPPGTGKSYTIAALAVDHLSRGESVLVASKMNHAVDVIANKIEDQLGIANVVVRAGRRGYLKQLKRRLDAALSGMHGIDAAGQEGLRALQRRHRGLAKEIHALERRLEKLRSRQVRRGLVLASSSAPLLAPFRALRRRWIATRTRSATPHWKQLARLDALLDELVALTAELVERQRQQFMLRCIAEHRTDLQNFRRALGARSSSRQQDFFGKVDFSNLFGVFPVWLVALQDIHQVLPLRREQFDVAILDEATQCDMASVLPVLQRAKRVIIVGDPKQLRHLSFLSRAQQSQFARTHQLDDDQRDEFNYRDRSILDLALERISDSARVQFLNEHYRSSPPIIRFSNERFYDRSLNLMTERPGAEWRDALSLVRCNGTRADNGENATEAERLVAEVEALVDGESRLPPGQRRSIGLLSPFRAQTDRLAREVVDRLSPEALETHSVMAGTPFTFQGEERDVMFLSFALDDDYNHAALRYLERPDVFNVAITRARGEQRLFVSLDPGLLPAESLLRAYLVHAEQSHADTAVLARPDLPEDGFSAEVRAALEAEGVEIRRACTVAGLDIDLLVSRGERTLGIDLIGFPGRLAPAFTLERCRMFRRAGLEIFPLPYAHWYADRAACLAAMLRKFEPISP